MSREPTSAQEQEEYSKVFGPKLGPICYALRDEVTWLHSKWRQYRILFAHSPERIELLNGVAGLFFGMTQRVMWDDVLLHVARLTDPPQSVGKDNLTLRRLPEEIEDCDLRETVDVLIDAMMEKVEFARQLRMRRLAHIDLALALEKPAKPLPESSRQDVESALAAIRGVLNEIDGHYRNAEVGYDHVLTIDDAEALAYHLQVAVDAEERRQNALKRGEAPSG